MKVVIFFLLQNISKTAETILLKKIVQNHGISVYKKALKSEHRKNYIFRDNKFENLGHLNKFNQILYT